MEPETASATLAICVRGLSKSFPNGKDTKVVLDGLSFDVQTNSIVTLLGHNGAGKTTTVRILTTLLTFDCGEVSVFSYNLRKDVTAIRSLISATGQFAAVDENLTGRENLVFFGQLRGLTRASARARAEDLLEQFDLTGAASQQVSEYSGGMRRRLDIAVSLCVIPRLLFLDEPTTGLDPISRNELWSYIRRLRDEGTTVVLTTQYLEEAEALSDTILVLNNHRVVASGSPENLRRQFGSCVCMVSFDGDIDATRFAKIQQESMPDVDVQVSGHKVSFSTKGGTADIVRIAQTLEDSKIQPTSFSVAPPTLDDIFVRIVKHQEA